MNYSLYSADRATHLKIVVVALAAAIMVVGVSIVARTSPPNGAQGIEAQIPLVKAGAPVAFSDSGLRMVR